MPYNILFRLTCVIVCLVGTVSQLQAEPELSGAPIFVDCPQNLSVDHCDTISYQLKAVHPITMQPSPAIRYHKEYGPGHIDERTGVWSFHPLDEGVRNSTNLVVVSASLGGHDTDADQNCSFIVWVNNRFPSLTAIGIDYRDTIEVSAEQTSTVWFRFSDPDACDTVSITATSVPTLPESSLVVTVSGDSAALSFTPGVLDAGMTFRVYISATDRWGGSTFVLHYHVLGVSPYAIRIVQNHNVVQGQFTNLAVELDRAWWPLSGFNMLIAYDNSALAFQGAQFGPAFGPTGCGWEYFTFRYGADGNCPGGCPSGLLRVVGMAETNNGPNHPICLLPESIPTTLFSLNFLVSNNLTLECQFLPIRFFWLACEDNTLASDDGQELFISSSLADFEQPDLDISNPLVGFPTYLGAQASCESAVSPGRPPVRRLISFINGGLDVVCTESVDVRGDVNLNGLPFEIADFAGFAMYFTIGLSVFTVNVNGQIAATDVNNDGVTLTLADLVSLNRVINGQATPPVQPPATSPNTAHFLCVDNSGLIFLYTPDTLGAVLLTYNGQVSAQVLQPDLTLWQHFDGQVTRILITPEPGGTGVMTEGNLLAVTPPVCASTVDAATSRGDFVISRLDQATDSPNDPSTGLPASFSLHQNYPNPFNASTVISFELPRASRVELEIVNILGAVVYRRTTHYSQGTHDITWDGLNESGHPVSSGIYYYRLRAGDFVESKKMILLK